MGWASGSGVFGDIMDRVIRLDLPEDKRSGTRKGHYQKMYQNRNKRQEAVVKGGGS